MPSPVRRLHPRPRLLALATAVLLTSGGLGWAAALAPMAEGEANTRLEQVREQIRSQRDQLEDTQITILNLQQDLNRIASQIKKNQATLVELQDSLSKQERAIQAKEGEIADINDKKRTVAVHVEKRLAAFYQTGEVGVLNALFAAGDLGELLNLQAYVQALFQHDQQSLAVFRSKISQLAKARDQLAKAKADLEALIRQMREAEQSLAHSQTERDALLKQAKAEEELYRQALKELETAAGKLGKTIEQSRQAAALTAKKQPAQPAGDGFAGRKGRLTPPAKGRISRRFGPYQDSFGNRLHSDGIDLEVSTNSTVTAVHAGRVIFADQMPSYGNMVIVDHGGQYYSLVSGLRSFAKKKNELVAAGDPLGITDDQGRAGRPGGLHLEIRLGAKPLDPLLWLDTTQLDQ